MIAEVAHRRSRWSGEARIAKRRLFRAALARQFAMTILAAATFALLCGVCTEASADCRDEVVAAFERLRNSGRPYRKEVTWVISDQQTSHATLEFLPPDRMREITTNGVPGYGAFQTIRVGQRAWTKMGIWPWSWREWDPGSMQTALEKGKDFSALSDHPIPADAVFACLGRVEYRGTAYLGYRTRFDRVILTVTLPDAASSEAQQQELLRKLQDMPREWRTVFVDPERMLPVYDLVAEENQLDSPRRQVQYNYPDRIRIEPPIWCSMGLCPVGW
jgi:hypothetical protein